MSQRKRLLPDKYADWLFALVVGIGLFFYFYFVIKPVLYYAAQEPVFFFDKLFVRDFLTRPGGMLEYCAALLSQFFYYPLIGSLLLAAMFILFIRLLRATLKKSTGCEPSLLLFIPATMLLIAHGHYKHPLAIDLVFLSALAFMLLFAALKSHLFRILFLPAALPIFYFFAGSGLFFFTLFGIFYEIVQKRQLVLPLIILLLSIVLPVASGSGLFLVRIKDAFTQPAFPHGKITLFLLVLYLTPLFIAFIVVLARKLNISFTLMQKPMWRAAAVVFSLTLFFGLPLLTNKNNQKSFWKFTYYARIGEWYKLLDLCRKPFPASPQVQCLINRALCHTGQLGDRMFRYPQDFGLNSLFLMDDVALSTPLIRSDLYFDLRHFNESKHWAHEAASVTGETCWNLQRLALLYLLYNEKPVARLYLEKLKKTIPLRTWAEQYAHFMKNDVDIKDDPFIGPMLDFVIKRDFLSFVKNPILDLQNLTQENPHNKFAADYLMMSFLLTRQLQKFVEKLEKDKPLPKHYQEALLVYVSQVPDSRVQLRDYRVAPETLQRFQAFQSTLAANQQNRIAAEKALAVNFSDTYWYYLIFHQRGSES